LHCPCRPPCLIFREEGVYKSRGYSNSISDLAAKRISIKAQAEEYVAAIKNVATTISESGYKDRTPPWPGTIYFEDISSETNMELVEILVSVAREKGALGEATSA